MPLNSIQIRSLVISPDHNYFGHHGQPAGNNNAVEVDEFQCVAGRGIPGDRFFDYKPDYKGQITFFAWEDLLRMWKELCVEKSKRDFTATRRNVITEGLDLSSLIGTEFKIQDVRFAGVEECRPCYWMNGAIHPDAETWMQGRGGLRARILTDGILRRSVVERALRPVDGKDVADASVSRRLFKTCQSCGSLLPVKTLAGVPLKGVAYRLSKGA